MFSRNPAASAPSDAIDLEALIGQANPSHHKDFLKFLLGETDALPSASSIDPITQRRADALAFLFR